MTSATNVIRLPTAAKRKVGQPWHKAARAESARLKAESPLAHRFARPFDRLYDKHEQILRRLVRTPELCIALAIYSALPAEQKQMADDMITQMARRSGGEAALQALFSTVERRTNFDTFDRWAAQLARVEMGA